MKFGLEVNLITLLVGQLIPGKVEDIAKNILSDIGNVLDVLDEFVISFNIVSMSIFYSVVVLVPQDVKLFDFVIQFMLPF